MLKTYIKTILTVLLICFNFINAYTQTITGTVYELINENSKNPLPGTNVFWLGTTKGTSTDKNGHFILSKKGITNYKMIISFVGYASDTLTIDAAETNLDIQLNSNKKELNEVVVKGD